MDRRRLFDDAGKLLLRATVAGLMLFHGLHKFKHGIGTMPSRLAERGLPSSMAYGVYIGEIVAPLFLLAGLGTRVAAGVLAFNMVVAIYVSHAADVFRVGRGGAWALELQAFYLLGAVAIALLGSGRFAVSGGRGRFD